MATTEVHDNASLSRFELREDGQLIGVLEYQRRGGSLVMTHTEILPGRRGNGLGERLVGAALDVVRARGLRVVPRCSFVAEYLGSHPEYADLAA